MHTAHRPGRMAALAVALTASLTAAGGLVASSATATPPSAQPASMPSAAAVAAGWLGRQFEANGDLPKTDGEAGIDDLPLAIVALASAGVGSKEITKGIGYLERNFASYVQVPESKTKSVDDPGRLAEVILAAVAAKVNPERFGGDKAANDLVARLLVTQVGTGTDTGLFGSPDAPIDSTAYTQGLALTALAAVGRPNAAGAKWLEAQQCSDGGWEGYRSGPAACPAPDPKTYVGPDTNDTALAIEGLHASKATAKVNPLPFLRSSQYAGGGFAYYGGDSSTQSPDPDSTAVVAQALVARGELSAVTRSKGVEAGLAAFQLGCSSPASERGAYRYPGTSGANLYATIQAIPAAMEKAYPVEPGSPSSSLPTLPCT